jgi:hypothetical protein
MGIMREAYEQANYLARKHFHVWVHELPDGKRREVLQVAKQQMRDFYSGVWHS